MKKPLFLVSLLVLLVMVLAACGGEEEATPGRTPGVTPPRTPAVTPPRTPAVTPPRTPAVTPPRTPALTPPRTPALTPGTPPRTPALTPGTPPRTPALTPGTPGAPVAGAVASITISMGPGRDVSATVPAQTGTATLTAQGNQTQVVLNVGAGPAGTPQPAHIHQGDCPGVGAVAHPLTNVANGASTTVVNATLNSLLTGAFSINVHQSEANSNVYTSCGNIPGVTP